MYPSRAFAAPLALSVALPVALAAVFVFSGVAEVRQVFAQEVEYVDIRSGKYKMTEYGETGEEVPRSGPIIEVFSRSGIDYDTIANDNIAMPFTLGVKGRCAGNQRVGKAELTLPGGGENLAIKKRRQTYSRRFKTVNVRAAFALPDIGRTPAQACVKELDRRVAGSSLSREEWIERGFVVRYDDAYKLGFALTCNQGKGWNQFGEAETTSPVWIACQPSKVAAAGARQVAGQGASGKPASQSDAGRETSSPRRLTERRTATAPAPTSPAALTQLISALALHTSKGDYRGRCPVALRFSGAVTVARAGTIRYRLIDDEGNSSPLRSLKFARAGSQNIIGWSKAFAMPAAGDDTDGSDRGADYEGWVQIQVVEPRRSQPSNKAAYQVTCK